MVPAHDAAGATADDIGRDTVETGPGDARQPVMETSPDPRPAGEQETGEPVCAACGGVISVDDLVCPHCGISLVSG